MKNLSLIGLGSFLTLLLAVGSVLASGNGNSGVCTGGIKGLNDVGCLTLEEADDTLSCGITNFVSTNCGSGNDWGDCWFAVGTTVTEDWILVEWPKDGATGLPPSPGACDALKGRITECSGEIEPFIRECPDDLVSGITPPGFCPECPLREDPDIAPLWTEPCRAYALMPEAWDHWTPAALFVTVGRQLPWHLLNEHDYDARRALLEDQLGIAMLGVVGTTPLWGALETGAVAAPLGLLAKERLAAGKGRRGLCIDPRGSLMASPFWEPMRARGIGQFPLLSECHPKGLDYYLGINHKTGKAIGENELRLVSAQRSLRYLERFAAGEGYDLVCVTEELAAERRAARGAEELTGQP